MDRTGACGASNRGSNPLEGTNFSLLIFNFVLDTPLAQLPGIGPQLQRKLKKLKLTTVRDLLFHFPHRYEDFSNLINIGQVKIGQNCCLKGEVTRINTTRTWKKKMLLTEALVRDATGEILVIWFNRPYLQRVLKGKDRVMLAGKILRGPKGIYLSNPSYEKLSPDEGGEDLVHTGRLVPVYPETEGLSSRWLRAVIYSALKRYGSTFPETLPAQIRQKYGFMDIGQALWQVHFPKSLREAETAKKRFAFQELFYISTYVLREKSKISEQQAQTLPLNLELMQKAVKSLPFKLTDAQKKSLWQILKDLEKPRPMNRLLQGDVGSGKTVVALISALNVIRNGYQVVFMAPTEILSRQHFKTAADLLAKFRCKMGLLTGKTDLWISPKLPGQPIEISRKKLLEKAAQGKIDLLCGTHALIQNKVKFGKLAFVILDEQHRFGVNQRAALIRRTDAEQKRRTDAKTTIPHLLSMTATPIPRTLALTIYGDLDLSLIDELPKGRKKIITRIVPPAERESAYEFIRQEVQKGRQVFVICPRIEKPEFQISNFESNSNFKNSKIDSKLKIKNSKLTWSEAKAVKEEYKKLSEQIFPDLKVGMLHGKMAAKEKDKIMQDFKRGKTDILVSTSVVEVGVDVPNATVMMIEGAERFGLAQLHQFRGRVGRAGYQSYCLLFTESPAKNTRLRLKALLECENGFELAEKDLAIRGPGDFAGTRQWGLPDMVMEALKDLKLVQEAREAAKENLMQDPYLKQNPALRKEVEKFRERIHLE